MFLEPSNLGGTIMSVLPSFKDIVGLIKKGANLEAEEKFIELKDAYLGEKESVHQLKERVSELENALKVQGALHWDGRVYWLKKDDSKNGPYCQQCYDANTKLMRLQKCDGYDYCLTCKNTYDHPGAAGKRFY